MKIGEIIASQLGGTRKLNAMTGAYNFLLLENGLSFRLKNPSANYVKIELNGKDLYDVEIGKVRGSSYKIVQEYHDIYNDQLKEVIEMGTGMYLSLEDGGAFGAGHFAEGGILSSSEIEKLDNGFTIKELSEMLNNKFRDSFQFEVYKQGKNRDLTTDYDNKLKDDKLKLKFYDKTSGRDLNYEVMQGEENTYFHFLLSDSEYNGYVGTFGFKDRGDVSKEYVTKFVAFLHDAYHYPFSVKHSVMENGGAFGAGHFARGGVLKKRKFSLVEIPDYNSKNERNGSWYQIYDDKRNLQTMFLRKHLKSESLYSVTEVEDIMLAERILKDFQDGTHNPNKIVEGSSSNYENGGAFGAGHFAEGGGVEDEYKGTIIDDSISYIVKQLPYRYQIEDTWLGLSVYSNKEGIIALKNLLYFKYNVDSSIHGLDEMGLKELKIPSGQDVGYFYANGGAFGAGHFAEGGDINAFTMQMVKGTGNINTEVITEERKISFEDGGAFGAGHFAKGGNVKGDGVYVTRYADGDYRVDVIRGNDYHAYKDIFKDSEKAENFAKRVAGNHRVDYKGIDTTPYDFVSKGSQSKKYGKYTPHGKIKTVTIKKGGKELTYKAEDVYNGVYVLENGGGLKGRAFYTKKADVVKVTLNDGSEVMPVNGFWIKKTAEPITGATTSDADSVFKRIIRDAKLVKVGDSKKYDAKDLKKINAEMVKKLLDAGYTEQQIRNKFLGYTHDNEVLADGEFAEYETTIFSYMEDYIPTIIQQLVDAQKSKTFAVTFEYPEFNWTEIIKKYKISTTPKEFVKKREGTWRYDYYYQFFQGENIVIDHNYGYKEFDKEGKLIGDTTKDGKKLVNANKLSAWQKERGEKAGFNNGFWTVSSSKIEVIDDVIKMLTSQKDGYCKEIEFYSDYNSELLKENGAKFENGGAFGNEKKISDSEWQSIVSKFLENFMADYGQDSSTYLDSKSINSDQPTKVSKRVVDRTVEVEESFPEATKKFISSLTPKEKSLVDIEFDEGEFADAESHDEIKNFSFIKVSKKQNYANGGAFGAGHFAMGGKVTFDEKSAAIAKNFVGKSVEPKYQSEYAETYSKEEASEVGDKIAGAQRAKYESKPKPIAKKKASGGSVNGSAIGNPKMKAANDLAKQIRKDGEKWSDALKRAHIQLKG